MFLEDPDVIKIAQTHNASPAQVALSWGIQRGTVVIPKSVNPDRMRQNLTVRSSCRCLTQRKDSTPLAYAGGNVTVDQAHERGHGRYRWYSQEAWDAPIAPQVSPCEPRREDSRVDV